MGKLTLFLICCFVAFMPFEMMAYFEDIPSGAKLVGMLMVGSAILAFLAGQPVRMLSWPMMVRAVLVLYSAMSLAWSLDGEETLSNIPRIAQLLIFILLVWEFAVTYREQMWVLRSFLVGMLVPLAMALATFLGASRFAIESGERFSGGGQDLNYVAYMCSVSILIAAYLASNSLPLDRYCRWGYWGLAVWCALEAMLTGSRGGFICMVTAGIFAMVLAGVSRRRIVTIVQVLAVLLFVYVLARLVVPESLLNRVTREQSIADDPRAGIWARGLAAVWKNPLFGVGAGAYSSATAVTGEKSGPAHNTFISVLVELGIVGLALYLIYTVMLFRSAWHLPRREKLLWTGVLVVWFLEAMSCGSQIDKFTWFVHVMLLVQVAACMHVRSAKRPVPYPNRKVPVVHGPAGS